VEWSIVLLSFAAAVSGIALLYYTMRLLRRVDLKVFKEGDWILTHENNQTRITAGFWVQGSEIEIESYRLNVGISYGGIFDRRRLAIPTFGPKSYSRTDSGASYVYDFLVYIQLPTAVNMKITIRFPRAHKQFTLHGKAITR